MKALSASALKGALLAASLLSAAIPTLATAAPLLQPGKHSLYQRVITRPGATMGTTAAMTDAKPIDGFEVFYVFARNNGKIQVGSSATGTAEGWIDESKTIVWPHTMVGAFTNPAGRNRALFLDNAEHEQDLLTSADSGQKAAMLMANTKAGKPGPVVALEPENYVDITKNFYLLPILDAKQIERDSGPSVRMLHVISAPAPRSSAEAISSPDALKNFKAGLVFVIDTTSSMEPYIEQTRSAIKSIIQTMQGTAAAQNFRFGLVAYRDSLSDTSKLEYETKVYAKPDFSQPVDAVLPAIADVHDAPISSSSFDEDAIAGVRTAVDSINWDEFAGRYMVLITDAGARNGNDPHSITHLNIDEARQLAAAKGIALFVVHLLTPAGDTAHDHGHAAAQYRNLSRFGTAGSLYYPVQGGSPEAFRPVVQALSTSLLQQVADTTGRPIAGLTPKGQAPDPKMAVVGQAMRLAYLGRNENTKAPDVVQSYTADRDPADTLHRSLDVRVLLTRNQLSDLAASLQHILDAGLAGRIEPQTFFTQLQSAFAASARDPSTISHIDRIGPLLGEYLDDLPYKSDVASITQDTWLAMGAIGQRTILNNIASRLRLYQDFESHPELWVHLGHSKDDGEAVYPVPLEALPLTAAPQLLHVRDLAWQSPDRGFTLHVPEFSVHAGDRFAITGPSGCGKSTLLGLLSLALLPVECQIFTLRGLSVNLTDTTARTRTQKAALRARYFGFVPQMSALLPFLSIHDNIRLPLDILNIKAPARLRTLAQRLDIEPCLTRMPARISVGQRQRAAIARALVHSPHLLLADEPTAALHPDQAENVMHLLSTETAADGAVLVVTHDPELARKAGYTLIPAILDGQTTRISTASKTLA